jgi:hypothetical protein
VVVGVVVVVVVVVDVLVDDVLVDVASVVEVVVVESTTSACVVGAAESVNEVVALDVGAASDVTISAGGAATVAGCGAAAVVGDDGSVPALLRVTDRRFEAALVALTFNRLVAALQRCLPQHRMIALRKVWSPAHNVSELNYGLDRSCVLKGHFSFYLIILYYT